MEEKINLEEVFAELNEDSSNPELIKDNKLHFRVDDKLYRVKMPNQKELFEATLHKDVMQGKFIQQKGLYTISQWKKILKENQNIDIDEMQKEIDDNEKELLQLYISLAHKKDSAVKLIKELIDKIKIVKEDRLKLVLDKAGFVAPAIQYKVQDEYYKYLTAQCTEVMVVESPEDAAKEKWDKVWNSFEKYQNDNSKIAYIALGKLNELMINV